MTAYALKLIIRYAFDRPTGAGRQLFRILPAEVAGMQSVRHSSVTLTPDVGPQSRFHDFFGTQVIEASIPSGHTALELTLTAEVDRMAEPLLDISVPLSDLEREIAAHHSVGPRAPHHFTLPSRRIPADPAIAGFARDLAAGCTTVRDLVEQTGRALHRHMTFDPAATTVDTPPAEAFAAARGVCQDFAHIMVGALRTLGVPAAYVAGYLRTDPPPGKPRLTGADAMHAWVRAWGGEEMGWIDYDPTNACFAARDHIDIGFGRDYADVAPVTGMLRLDGNQTGSHSVDIVPL